MSTTLIRYDAMRQAIIEAHSIDEVKDIRDKAEALRQYARQAGESLENQNMIAEIRLRAERRAGELIAEMPKATGGQPYQKSTPDTVSGVDAAPSLAALGISHKQSSRFQAVASIPEPLFEEHIAETKASGAELTSASVAKVAQKIKKQVKRERHKASAEIKPPIIRPPCHLYVTRAESMPQVLDETVDIIITSPPYNLGDDNWPMGGDGRTTRDGIGYNAHGDDMTQAQYECWQVNVLREMFRVAKPGASFFYNHKVRTHNGRMIHPVQWLSSPDNPWTLRQEIIWDRKSTHNHSATLFWPIDERIYWMTKGKPTLRSDAIGMPTVWQEFGPVANTWHPAPFTEKLPDMLLRAVGVDADVVVLDPFAGSGTTLRAALRLGCTAIGTDISREYLEESCMENGWGDAIHN